MKLILIIMLILSTSISFAQNAGIGTITPTEKLDIAAGNVRIRDINTTTGAAATDKVVTATTTGILKTVEFGEHKSFTTAQMNAISSPNPGRTIYNSDENGLYTYNGTNWVGNNSKTFSASGTDTSLTINTNADISSTFILAGKQNVMITASFVPQCNTNSASGTTIGNYRIIVDGIDQETRPYTAINTGAGELSRYSSVATYSGSLNPGSHIIILRVVYTGGTNVTYIRNRKLDIFVH